MLPSFYEQKEIQNREAFVSALWRGEGTKKVAFQIVPLADGELKYSEKEIEENPQKSIDMQLEYLKKRAVCDDYYIPLLVPFGSVLVIASAFGGRIICVDDNTPPWIEPILENASQANRLKTPNLDDGLIPTALKSAEYFSVISEGAYPIRAINHQGPFTNACYLLGDTQIMLDMNDHPRQLHFLLEMITELMIKFIHAQKKRIEKFIPNIFYPDWMPFDLGIGVADDFLAILSPELYQEFGVPYNNVLSEEFDGIHLHSCGKWEHNFETVLKHKNLRGVNMDASQNDMNKAMEVFSGKALVVPQPGLHLHFIEKFKDTRRYVQNLLKLKKDNTALYIVLEEGAFNPISAKSISCDVEIFNEAIKLVREYNNAISDSTPTR